MACFPGSSGSPLFYIEPKSYIYAEDNKLKIGEKREKIFFMGILYSGPTLKKDGQIVFENTPKVQVDLMINLGNVIGSSTMLDIENSFLDMIKDKI